MAAKKTMIMFFLSTCILMVFFESNSISVNGEIACSNLITNMLPCKDFVLGIAGKPSGECCGNLQGLDNQAKGSAGDRRAICQCFKDTFKAFPVDPQKLQQLIQICQLSKNLPTDPNVDCNGL